MGPTVQRGERAQRDALGPRARGHEAQLRGAPAGARASERELPGRLVGEVARRIGAFASSADRAELECAPRRSRPRLGAGTACERALQRCVPVVDNSKITRGSRHPRRPFSIPLHGAYGVSCRARVNVYATPHWCGDSPQQPHGCSGSPAPKPLGAVDSARTGGKLTDPLARCITWEGLQAFLPTNAAAQRPPRRRA